MEIIVPDDIRLIPGQSLEALYSPAPEFPNQIGFFLRSTAGELHPAGDFNILQKAGLVQFNGVMLVVTMLKIENETDEYFDIWWNYYAPNGKEHFRQIAEQEKITIHFYGDNGIGFSIDRRNEFRKFFKSLPHILSRHNTWNHIEFDRAVRGFCAQAYPKELLWESLDAKKIRDSESKLSNPEYKGYLPPELSSFYVYHTMEGHCIKIIPSMLEQDAILGNPEEFLHAAPVKTVLRCGLRWIKGFPVAPIPFIPGHGLAFPPDDREF